jgi:Rrf2 family nitric oxide-sensitive transcriptional repressor
MRLTTFTDYTLRTLMYLAVAGDRTATIAGIAVAYGISEAHLMKVVHRLGLAGDVTTVRGRNGGIRLARPASEINLGEIVRRTETDMTLVPCFADSATCAIGAGCSLTAVLHEAMAAFLAVLDRYTLADLTTPPQGLAALLGIVAPGDLSSPPRDGAIA